MLPVPQLPAIRIPHYSVLNVTPQSVTKPEVIGRGDRNYGIATLTGGR